ncbi:MAG: anhydro-N-acetylmuramic acid kinase [Planctomycetes bacterium]|nr:anhydro-N-acetylmuramic acid kinase [Planctomycetota bacterium]
MGPAMLAVGLMSGTSADGVTAVLVRVGRGLRVLRHRTFPFHPRERRRILSLATADARVLSEANFWIGERFAEAARRIMRGAPVTVIGSHGQTVWHEPGRHTLQLGEASVIAERTGVTVVADFRPRDIAAGGQGAPLVPYVDAYLFGGDSRVRALQNIGGIANVTIVGGKRTAFDTGPGNALIDEAVRIATRGRQEYDEDGRIAARGSVDEALVARLMGHPYFAKRPPKSTGRELFSRTFLLERCERMLRSRAEDAIATLTCFTARSIADAYRRFVRDRIDEVVVSGGGALNPVLMRHLREMLDPVPVRSLSAYGIDPMAKEAAAFALLAVEAVRGRLNTAAWATGARRGVVAGKIVPGRNFIRLLTGAAP